jgi:2,5-diketo-D-gluconate reductase A
VAAETGRTAAQVMIRWVLQKGIVALVKSATPERIRENAAALDFELAADQMRRLDALEAGIVVQDWFPKGYY